ncbi:MAG: copper resistance protein CopD [Thermoanaerobaculia bacterium]|nr:MAG: copper resistance protein CopD [Thermoanaerobaculia bacterium]MBZ0100659.1 CopD family protein [Thermoanaerobaculia bacterium]
MYGAMLLLHILAATIWTGGHLVLAIAILPRVLRERSPARLLEFESAYERVGIPALVVQVATGLWLAHRMVPEFSRWFAFGDPVATLVGVKLLLLAATVAFALDARLRLIPELSEKNLTALAWHIVPVTLVSVLFVVVGVSFRTGWFY